MRCARLRRLVAPALTAQQFETRSTMRALVPLVHRRVIQLREQHGVGVSWHGVHELLEVRGCAACAVERVVGRRDAKVNALVNALAVVHLVPRCIAALRAAMALTNVCMYA